VLIGKMALVWKHDHVIILLLFSFINFTVFVQPNNFDSLQPVILRSAAATMLQKFI